MRSSPHPRHSRFIITAALLLALAGCGPALRWNAGAHAYVVKKGDTLYSIAFRRQLDYHTLAKWNGIQRPYKIYPGETLRLTSPSGSSQTQQRRSARSAPPPAPKKRQKKPRTASRAHHKKRTVSSSRSRSNQKATAIHWKWPAEGKVIRKFSPAKNSKGIDIAGQKGEPIRASASGKVVYSGNGLRGYGQLIIIKHGGAYLSAYSHNKMREVKEGQHIKQGQEIAKMGLGPERKALVHFEIRHQGQPVDPLSLLPSR